MLGVIPRCSKRFSRKAWLVHHSLHHCCGQRWLRTKANSSLQCLTCPAVPLYHPTIMSPTFYQIFFHHFFSTWLSVRLPRPRVVGVLGWGLEVVTGQTYTAGGIILFYSYEHWQNILYSCGERPIVTVHWCNMPCCGWGGQLIMHAFKWMKVKTFPRVAIERQRMCKHCWLAWDGFR